MADDLARVLFHLGTIARIGSDWERGFARSILRQSRNPGWRPSARQLETMRGLVDQMFSRREPGADDFDVIEEGGREG